MSQQRTHLETPSQSCDIVMKGGITSGVVYPLALVALSKKYRLANIGGTSAGAIAAAAAAAAEYGRHVNGAGFDRLAKIPAEVGPHLLSLFQPTPVLKPLFNIFVATLKAKTNVGRLAAFVAAAIGGYLTSAFLGALPGIIVTAIAIIHADAGTIAFGLLLALVGLVLTLIMRLKRAVTSELADNDFGICPGIRQLRCMPEAFTDWLARLIEEAAGHQAAGRPLTFGDLLKPPDSAEQIHLKMVTTSLAEGRPYTLPMETGRFFFKREEWERLFPAQIIEFLVKTCKPFTPTEGVQGEFYCFPSEDQLPLIVAARMSLSFPFLISAVPLWTRDFLMKDGEKQKLRRCLFSDGGLSSNFPIQFFDHLLPNSPTFAISLDDFDPLRTRDLVWLPQLAVSGAALPLQSFEGLFGFIGQLFYSAKDWRDNLQSTLSGYRERIVHVVLKPEEGGLNLTMSKETIDALVERGKEAGEKLCNEFDMNEHRWRRFLVSMARMEETLDEVAAAYAHVPGRFGDFLTDYVLKHAPYRVPKSPGKPPPYSQDTKAQVDEMLKRAVELVDLGAKWRKEPTIRDGVIPKPVTDLRITPRY
jgi:predicted acylesterase/phospholipase RssA